MPLAGSKRGLRTLEAKGPSKVRVSTPANLDLALEGLVRKVLREQPKQEEIYSFAADYFETLLEIREKAGPNAKAKDICPEQSEVEGNELIKLATSFPKPVFLIPPHNLTRQGELNSDNKLHNEAVLDGETENNDNFPMNNETGTGENDAMDSFLVESSEDLGNNITEAAQVAVDVTENKIDEAENGGDMQTYDEKEENEDSLKEDKGRTNEQEVESVCEDNEEGKDAEPTDLGNQDDKSPPNVQDENNEVNLEKKGENNDVSEDANLGEVENDGLEKESKTDCEAETSNDSNEIENDGCEEDTDKNLTITEPAEGKDESDNNEAADLLEANEIENVNDSIIAAEAGADNLADATSDINNSLISAESGGEPELESSERDIIRDFIENEKLYCAVGNSTVSIEVAEVYEPPEKVTEKVTEKCEDSNSERDGQNSELENLEAVAVEEVPAEESTTFAVDDAERDSILKETEHYKTTEQTHSDAKDGNVTESIGNGDSENEASKSMELQDSQIPNVFETGAESGILKESEQVLVENLEETENNGETAEVVRKKRDITEQSQDGFEDPATENFTSTNENILKEIDDCTPNIQNRTYQEEVGAMGNKEERRTTDDDNDDSEIPQNQTDSDDNNFPMARKLNDVSEGNVDGDATTAGTTADSQITQTLTTYGNASEEQESPITENNEISDPTTMTEIHLNEGKVPSGSTETTSIDNEEAKKNVLKSTEVTEGISVESSQQLEGEDQMATTVKSDSSTEDTAGDQGMKLAEAVEAATLVIDEIVENAQESSAQSYEATAVEILRSDQESSTKLGEEKSDEGQKEEVTDDSQSKDELIDAGRSRSSKDTESLDDEEAPFISAEVRTLVEEEGNDGELKEDEMKEDESDVIVPLNASMGTIDEKDEGLLASNMGAIHAALVIQKNFRKYLTRKQATNNDQEIEEEKYELNESNEAGKESIDSSLSNSATQITSKRIELAKSTLETTTSQSLTETVVQSSSRAATPPEDAVDTQVWSRLERELDNAAATIQNTYRESRQRLRREDAVQITTTASEESADDVKWPRLQGTGELHDTIVPEEKSSNF